MSEIKIIKRIKIRKYKIKRYNCSGDVYLGEL